MPDVNEIYQSQFLRAAQLVGRPRRVTIEQAVVELIGQGEKAQQKIVLKFRSVRPRLPLNKTNATYLASQWGPHADKWTGREVELRSEKVMFSGSMVDSIRVYVLPASPPAAPAEESPMTPPDGGIGGMEDDLPW